jgi:hypothetical protein
MTVCHASVVNRVSESWLYVLSRFVGRKPEDEMRRATMLLNSSIKATASIETEISGELHELAARVRQMNAKHVKADLNAVLISSRHKRLKLQQTTKKRIALERHLETLHSTLLNQQVMSSVKQTSDVLKAMGLERELEQIDSVNLDLNETLSDARAIQLGLAERVGDDYDEDIDLQAEMDLLLDDDAGPARVPLRASLATSTTAPAASPNSMQPAAGLVLPPLPPAPPASTSALLETVPEHEALACEHAEAAHAVAERALPAST